MTTWLTIFFMGVVTYALRLSLIAAIGRLEVPPLVQRPSCCCCSFPAAS